MKQVILLIGLTLLVIFAVGCTPTQVETKQEVVENDRGLEPVKQIDPPSLEVESAPVEEPIEEEVIEEEPEPEEVVPEVAEEEKSIPATKLAANYYRFNKAHYEQSLEQGKIIFLDFHADWCPTCVREQPHIFDAFDELNDPTVVGYQVHYNDENANQEDKDAAKKYGITYQHTKVVVGSDGKMVSKSLESFTKQDVLDKIAEAKA